MTETNGTSTGHNDGTVKSTTAAATTATTTATTTIPTLSSNDAELAIQRFQAFCRFETVSATAPRTGAYVECATFLVEQLRSIASSSSSSSSSPVLDNIHFLPEAPDHSPVVVAVWKGKDSTLPILLLNSHYDVVPADTTAWTVPPFAALRKDGNIYGRGTQDMKCVCMQYIEAIRYMVQEQQQEQQEQHVDDDHDDPSTKKTTKTTTQWQPERDIYLTFVPDEEVGGSGMAAFLESSLYKNLPNGIALALDEGLASTTNTFDVFYGERLPWWVHVTATGPTGHGSRFIDNTAVSQLVELANKALAFRTRQRHELLGNDGDDQHQNCTHAVARKRRRTLGDVTTLNITTLQAGVPSGDGTSYALNCVPPVATCTLDIRISPTMAPSEMKQLLDTWCQECSKAPNEGAQVTWDSKRGGCDVTEHATTSTDTTVNPWYGVFCEALSAMQCDISPQVFPAATDSRFLRALGIRALGFSPMRNTEIMLHENDEYIPESTFLEGIGVYVNLIRALGSHIPNEE
jgi:aminoacylase